MAWPMRHIATMCVKTYDRCVSKRRSHSYYSNQEVVAGLPDLMKHNYYFVISRGNNHIRGVKLHFWFAEWKVKYKWEPFICTICLMMCNGIILSFQGMQCNQSSRHCGPFQLDTQYYHQTLCYI